MRETIPKIKLGEVCDIIGGGTPSKKREEFYGGDIPWATVRDMNYDILNETDFTITELGLENSSANIISKGNIIIATRVGLGKVCKLKQDTAINQDLKGIIPKNDNLLTDYLFLWFKSISEKIIKAGTGATVQGVKIPFVKNLEIPIPPLPEQKRIVAILDEVFEAIDRAKTNIEKNIQNADELFRSKLNEMLSKQKENWEKVQLEDIADLNGRIGWKGLTAKEYTQEGPLFLSVHSLNYGDFVVYRDANHITIERYDESPEIMLKTNDILICKDGAGIGKLGIVGELPDKATVNSSLLVIRSGERVYTKYLYYSLLSPYFQKIVQSRLEGATTPHLYQRDIKNFPVFLPSLDEQNKVIQTLDLINDCHKSFLKNYMKKVNDLEELKKSILYKAFSGELTQKETVAA